MQAKKLQCKIVGIGAWGGYFESWEALQAILQGGNLPDEKLKGPKPSIIPSNERRRAPLPVRLAVESSWQATQSANISPEALTCVFVSGLGDTDLTDYMCKTLASDNKELSPTKFHNSVHNAAAGYWTISTNTMTAANSVAGYKHSVALAIFEAMVQCESENTPMLVTFYDSPASTMLKPLMLNRESFAFSLILFPASHDIDGTAVEATIDTNITAWPKLNCNHEYIQSLYNDNPSARILCLAEYLDNNGSSSNTINMPLSLSSSLSIKFL
ncbi:beta-ketoacyl synthase chain length factor [Eionea flava]